jgi:LmbE family N-acetylglucosaminyl deacetylase
VIYTHHGGDLNIDHRLVHQAVLTHCRPQPGTRVRAIYGAESVSSTEWASPGAGTAFVPTHFVDITAQLDRKMMALNCYESEMRPFPHARSKDNILALARTRGASVGVAAAEAFVTLRTIVT